MPAGDRNTLISHRFFCIDPWIYENRRELTAGFNRAVINPRLHSRVGLDAFPDGKHPLVPLIHLRLRIELNDHHASVVADPNE